MPYFSFSTRESFNIKSFNIFKKNYVYYSKNTKLWKIINSNSNKKLLNYCRVERRKKVKNIKSKILFCLPPSIGFGDAVEYGLAIKNIKNTNKFKYIGVAFVGKFSILYKKYFNCEYIFEDVIIKEDLEKFDTIFHFTLEIESLIKQKYLRLNITEEIRKYFKYELIQLENQAEFKKINKISIFPISKSPIRTMPVIIINELINYLKDKVNLDICFDINSNISDFIEKNIFQSGYNNIKPLSFESLLDYIKTLQYGIFMDSGPFHFAKYLNKQGLLIETSVSSNILLNNFKNIKSINNKFVSNYCSAPCGLTNIFNYKNNIGCYQSIKIKRNKIINLNNFNNLQRGQTKNYYIHYLKNPVGCLKNLDISIIKNELNRVIN